MQTTVNDDRGRCLSVTRLNSDSLYKKIAKRIKILFGVNTLGGQETLC